MKNNYGDIPNFCVLMSTYNGEKYIVQQLDSIMCQNNVDVTVFIRDDGSSDSTLEIINEYCIKHPEKIYRLYDDLGNLGFSRSFFELLQYAYSKRKYSYYAFSDQDDVWLDNKLYRAYECIKKCDKPALYGSKKILVDENLNRIEIEQDICIHNFWDFFSRFNVSGCTEVFNTKFAKMLVDNDIHKIGTDFHDAYIGRLALCINAKLFVDNESYILYRQHSNNTVGALKEESIICKIFDIKKILMKRKHYYQKLLSNMYQVYGKEIPKENRDKIDICLNYNKSIYMKVLFLKKYIDNYSGSLKSKWIFVARIILNFI